MLERVQHAPEELQEKLLEALNEAMPGNSVGLAAMQYANEQMANIPDDIKTAAEQVLQCIRTRMAEKMAAVADPITEFKYPNLNLHNNFDFRLSEHPKVEALLTDAVAYCMVAKAIADDPDGFAQTLNISQELVNKENPTEYNFARLPGFAIESFRLADGYSSDEFRNIIFYAPDRPPLEHANKMLYEYENPNEMTKAEVAAVIAGEHFTYRSAALDQSAWRELSQDGTLAVPYAQGIHLRK